MLVKPVGGFDISRLDPDKIVRKNYKEDFKVLVTLPDKYRSGYPFSVTLHSKYSSYTVEYDGEEYKSCKMIDEKHVMVVADDHKLRCGIVEAEVSVYIPDTDMPDGNVRLVTRKPVVVNVEGVDKVLVLHTGESDDIVASELQIEALANFIKGDKGDNYILTASDMVDIANIVLAGDIVDDTLTKEGKAADAKKVGAKFFELETEVGNIHPVTDEAGYHVVDEQGNIGMQYTEQGFGAAKVQPQFVEVLKQAGVATGSALDAVSAEVEEEGFFFVDEQLNVGVKVDSDGIHAKNILEYEIVND